MRNILSLNTNSAKLIRKPFPVPTPSNYTPKEYFTFTAESGRIFRFSADGILHDQPAITVVSVPPTYDGPEVQSIFGEAFADSSTITAITFPDTITDIGHNNFVGCTSLVSITIGAGVTVGVGNLEFDVDYAAVGSRAGTYRLTDGKWKSQ